MSRPSFSPFQRPLTYAISIAITFASAAVEAQKVKAIKRGRARKCYYMFGFMKYCPKFISFISVVQTHSDLNDQNLIHSTIDPP